MLSNTPSTTSAPIEIIPSDPVQQGSGELHHPKQPSQRALRKKRWQRSKQSLQHKKRNTQNRKRQTTFVKDTTFENRITYGKEEDDIYSQGLVDFTKWRTAQQPQRVEPQIISLLEDDNNDAKKMQVVDLTVD